MLEGKVLVRPALNVVWSIASLFKLLRHFRRETEEVHPRVRELSSFTLAMALNNVRIFEFMPPQMGTLTKDSFLIHLVE